MTPRAISSKATAKWISREHRRLRNRRPLDVHAAVARFLPVPSRPERAVLFIETIPSIKEDDQ